MSFIFCCKEFFADNCSFFDIARTNPNDLVRKAPLRRSSLLFRHFRSYDVESYEPGVPTPAGSLQPRLIAALLEMAVGGVAEELAEGSFFFGLYGGDGFVLLRSG